MNEPVDLVLPYVSMKDPIWLEQFLKIDKDGLCNHSRFRDFETIGLLFQLIDKFCPWIRYIYLIVQIPSQVPECIKNYDKVKIVYHNEIIPKKYLPTYNSNTLDLFHWRIPGLSEHYIYANDDIYPIAELTKDDFFDDDGNPKIRVYTVPYTTNVSADYYKRTLKKTEKLCNPNFTDCDVLYRDGHSWNAMRVSTWKMLSEKYEKELKESITRFRSEINITQQLYTYWVYFNEPYSEREFDVKYFSLKNNGDEILEKISEHQYKIICINDKWCTDFIKSKTNINNILLWILNN